jgi:tetratricopeptide (TPR) repeat protein
MLALSWPAQGQKLPNMAVQGDRGAQQHSVASEALQHPWTVPVIAPRIASESNASAPAGAKVSVTELQIPPAAQKELQIFQEKFVAGKMEDAAKHVEKAIRIYPQLAGAHHNLGLCYARLNQYDKAAAEFQNAAELDARLVEPRVSLSDVFLLQGKYAEGEVAARSALDLDPANREAGYFLGRNLVSAGHDTAEAMDLLRKSRDQFPGARLALVNVYLKQHATDEALEELRDYLEQPNAPWKDKVACMVVRLTQPNGSSTCVMK